MSPLNTKLKKFTNQIDEIESPSYKRRYGERKESSEITSFKGLTLKLMKWTSSLVKAIKTAAKNNRF